MEQNEAAIAAKQELFDRVATHLFTQRKQAVEEVDGGTKCRYRTPDGLSCAIGCLIPDNLYDPSWENVGVDWGNGAPIREAAGITEATRQLATDLQCIHDFRDNWLTPPAMLRRLRAVARLWELSDAVLTPELVGGEEW